jgi:hypothetical protein
MHFLQWSAQFSGPKLFELLKLFVEHVDFISCFVEIAELLLEFVSDFFPFKDPN